MSKAIMAVDKGQEDGDVAGFTILKGGQYVYLTKEEAKRFCKDMAKQLELEVIEQHRLKVFDDEVMKPNAKYLGSFTKEHS